MTRVLHVPAIGWQPTEGIARSCRALAVELAAAYGVQSDLVANRDTAPYDSAFANTRVIRGWTPATPWKPAFVRAIRELRPDVVHVHGGELAPAVAFAPSLRDLPVVVTCYAATRLPEPRMRELMTLWEHHGNVSTARAIAGRAGLLRVARRALASGRVAIVCTPDSKVEARFAGAGAVLHTSGAASVAALPARWSDEPVVVFAGRAQRGRGIDDLIAAFGVVRGEVPGARLRLLLLPGGSAARWQAELAPYPWAEVRVGGLARLDLELAKCQAGAFPFRWSATMTPALAAAEAMAAGLPIVATTVECLAPLVDHGRNGYLVPPNDPVALGRALARVLRGPEQWQPLSEGARKTIDEHWSWRAAAAVTHDAYELAITAPRRSR